MPTAEDALRERIEGFVSELSALVRRSALEAASAALGGATAAAAAPAALATRRGRGRPRKVAAPKAAAAPIAAKAGKAAKSTGAPAPKAAVGKKAAARAPGAKRPPGELVKITERLGDYIKSHPGQRMEAIGKALGTPTRELNLPIKKLVASKKVRTEGHKRATEYYPA